MEKEFDSIAKALINFRFSIAKNQSHPSHHRRLRIKHFIYLHFFKVEMYIKIDTNAHIHEISDSNFVNRENLYWKIFTP